MHQLDANKTTREEDRRQLHKNICIHTHTHIYIYIYIYIYKLSWLKNPANTYMRHMEYWTAVSTLLGLISRTYHDPHYWWSNQQSQNAEAETLPLGHRFISHISDAELTSHGDNARPLNLMCLEGTYSLQRTRSPPELRLPKVVLWIHLTLTSWAGYRIIFLYLNGGIQI